MKILFLFPHFLTPGGAAHVVLQYAAGLQSKGHEVVILCANASPEFCTQHGNLKIVQLGIPNSSSMAYWFLMPFWQRRINLVLTEYQDYVLCPQVLPSSWWAWAYKRQHPAAKIAWYCHEPSAFIHSRTWINALTNPVVRLGAKAANPFLKWLDLKWERENDLVICNSQFTASQYETTYGCKPAEVIYPPSDIQLAPLTMVKQDYFLTVCRLTKFKRVDALILAFQTLLQKHPKYQLRIAGDGESRPELERLVRSLQLEERVQFLGWTDGAALRKLYQQAKATVSYSQNETFGLVPIESMMSGTPVISHNSGGPRETILHGENGYLFDHQEQLVDYMTTMIDMEAATYSEMQRKCQLTAQKFDLKVLLPQLEMVLEQLSS